MDYSQLGKKQIKRKQNSQTTRVRNKISLLTLRITLAVVLIGGFTLLGAGVGLYMGILNNAPELYMEFISSGYHSSVIINYHTGEEMVRLHGGHNHETVTLDQIPLHVQNAFIAIEDERFWTHNGIDIRAIGRAAYTIISTAGARTEGASTITQQLIKNMLGRFDSDVITKLQEQYLAVNFERMLAEQNGGCTRTAKEFILESYLNIINLGRQNYGVQAAAHFYYGVDVWDLTIAQAATIAAITQNPSRFPPDIRAEFNWRRAMLVLENMYRLEFITSEEFAEAMEQRPIEGCDEGRMIGVVYDTIFRIEGGGTRPVISHFDCFTDALLDSVRDDLMREFGLTRDMANNMIFTRGLRIYSTQHEEKQAAVDRVFLDESYWPAADFTLDIDYHLSLYNSVTNHPRHYRIERQGFRNQEEVDSYVYNFKNERQHEGDTVTSELLLITPQPQAAFVLLDHHNGHVLALRGVRGEKLQNRTLNRATQAARSPGSQMKPLASFAPAFEMGIMQPATVIDDVPFTNPTDGWTPRNWWGSTFEGLSTARRAIYRSMNVVSVRAIMAPEFQSVGLGNMFTYMQNFGFTTLAERYVRRSDGAILSDIGGALTLGGMTHGVHLIELAGAYGAIANMGELNRPVLYVKVLDHEGNVILLNDYAPNRILRDTTAYLLIDTMKDTLTASGATGHRANFTNQEMRRNIPIMGKTGTSQDSADLGFTGSTPYFTGAIWMGNDSNQRMSRTANQFHTPAWASIMQEVHYGLPPRQFIRPSNIVTAIVCLDSGHLATELCRADPRGNRSRNEVFAAQHAPRNHCEVHQQFTYCTLHNYIAGHFCPPEYIRTRVGLVRSIPIQDSSATVSDRIYEFPPGVRQGITCPNCTGALDWGTDFWGGWNHPNVPGGLGDLDLPTHNNDFWGGGQNVQQAPAQPWSPSITPDNQLGPTPTPTPVPGTVLPPLQPIEIDPTPIQPLPVPAEQAPAGGLWPTIPVMPLTN